MKLFLFIILFSTSSFAQQGILGNYLKLNPTTLPAVCSQGTTRFDASGHTLSLCYPANTWTAVGSGGGGGGLSNPITIAQIPTPTAAPSPSVNELYFKSDGNLYSLNHSGLEQSIGQGMQGTPWSTNLSFTPSAAFGTVTGATYLTRRVCDQLEVKVTFTAGTNTAATMSLAMPSGYVIDSTKLSSLGSFINGNATSLSSPGSLQLSTGEFQSYPFYDGSDTGNIYFSAATASGTFTKALGTNFVDSSAPWVAEFQVPIVGWSCQSPQAPGQSGANQFISPAISTNSSVVSSTSFVNFSNSPAFSVTPTVTGTYKVWAPATLDKTASGNTICYSQIVNTSGGATLFSSNIGNVYSNNNQVETVAPLYALYTLTAGVTYVFDIQGKVDIGGGVILAGADGTFSMIAELYAGTLGNGVTQIGNLDAAGTPSPQGQVLSNNFLYAQSASSSNPGLVNNTAQTFSGSKTLGFNLSDAITIGAGASSANQTINGGLIQTVKTITSNYTLDTSEQDYVIKANCASACTLTLTAASSGRIVRVTDINGSAAINNITITPNGVETINGSSNLIINVNNASVDLNGILATGWNIQ